MSSTGGAGGVLDRFYDRWKLELTLENERYAQAMSELYGATYATSEGVWSHPYGVFDHQEVWAHVDRIGFRVPDSISELHAKGSKTLQRSLTPHLDCCPSDMYGSSEKQFARWRPIQCLISLTDTSLSDSGGFECVSGFHRRFDAYFEGRAADNSPHIQL